MRSENELVCVNCPKGCRIHIVLEDRKIIEISGYSCEKGRKYAEEEMVSPMRVLTSTVRILDSSSRVLPVMTSQAIPLSIRKEAMEEIRSITVHAPIRMNDVIVSHFMGCEADLIASRSMEEE